MPSARISRTTPAANLGDAASLAPSLAYNFSEGTRERGRMDTAKVYYTNLRTYTKESQLDKLKRLIK